MGDMDQSVDISSTQCTCFQPPVIVAPMKVLKFLDAALHCCDGVCKTIRNNGKGKPHYGCYLDGDQLSMFVGVTHTMFNSSPFVHHIRDMIYGYELRRPPSLRAKFSLVPSIYRPFRSMLSVAVDHCPDSYALLLAIEMISPYNKHHIVTYNICHSGDTRPSSHLVHTTRNFFALNGIHLLVHESTFDHDEHGRKEAVAKRHSTVYEALQVAHHMNVNCCLLTHFSHRYKSFPLNFSRIVDISGLKLKVGFAVDGLILPLCEGITEIVLPLINQCNKKILSLYDGLKKQIYHKKILYVTES